METTNLFSTQPELVLRELNNNNDLSDQDIYPFLSGIMKLYNLVELILKAHAGEVQPDLDSLGIDPDLLEPEDIAVACYQDEIAAIDYESLIFAADSLYSGYYCPVNYSTDCFVDSIKNLCEACKIILNTISNGDPVDFDRVYKEAVEQFYYDLNYCIIVNFKLMYYENGEILSCVKYYSAMTNTDIKKLADKMSDISEKHRPDLEFLNKYPEIFDKLLQYTPKALLYDLFGVSDCVENEEWADLLPDKDGKVKRYLDQDFIDELYVRNEQKMLERVGVEL
jgi:hypothetical protein